jgi:hypothetical protein
MAKQSYGTDGRPACPTGDLGGFAPGQPDTTNIKGRTEFPGEAKADAALATWGGVSRAKKNDSVTAHGAATLPK